MFNVIKVGISTGSAIEVSGSLVTINFIKQSVSSPNSQTLEIPWETDQDSKSIFNLLRWARRLSDFCGRDEELEKLHDWINADQKVSIKFITGDGGTGKTRLAAEFAQEMKDKKWDAGFVNLHEESEYSLSSKKGTLVLVDYPEQNPDAVKQLFHSLENFKTDKKLRILFLSRTRYYQWQELLIDTRKSGFVPDEQEIFLKPVDDDSAYRIYTSAAKRACDLMGVNWMNIPKEALVEWLHNISDENTCALFILGAALHDATRPKDERVQYTVLEIVDALVERELKRLREYSESKGIKNPNLLSTILAMATIAGFAPVYIIKEWVKNEGLNLKLKKDQDIEQILKDARLVIRGSFIVDNKEKTASFIQALEPDIVASYFVLKVQKKERDFAPIRVWHSLNDINRKNALYRYERSDYDVKNLLYHSSKDKEYQKKERVLLSEWLEKAFSNSREKCKLFMELFNDTNLSECIIPAAEEVYSQLSDHENTDEGKVHCFFVLSNIYSQAGKKNLALEAIEISVSLCRKIENEYYQRQYLALGLSNQSNRYNAVGKYDKALESIIESIEIYMELDLNEDKNYRELIGNCLNNKAQSQMNLGDYNGAIESMEESLKIAKSCLIKGKTNIKMLFNIASRLANLAGLYSQNNKHHRAVETIEEAEQSYLILVDHYPERYESQYAVFLNNQSTIYSHNDQLEKAQEKIDLCISIFDRIVERLPNEYYPKFGASLVNQSTIYARSGKVFEAIESIKRAIKIFDRYAKNYPDRFLPDLAKSIAVYSNLLVVIHKLEEAKSILEYGISIIRPYAQKYSGSTIAKDMIHMKNDLKEIEKQIEESGK